MDADSIRKGRDADGLERAGEWETGGKYKSESEEGESGDESVNGSSDTDTEEATNKATAKGADSSLNCLDTCLEC